MVKNWVTQTASWLTCWKLAKWSVSRVLAVHGTNSTDTTDGLGASLPVPLEDYRAIPGSTPTDGESDDLLIPPPCESQDGIFAWRIFAGQSLEEENTNPATVCMTHDFLCLLYKRDHDAWRIILQVVDHYVDTAS